MDRRKEAILQLLKGSGHATLAGVAEPLEVSKEGAIQHLEALEAASFVVRSSETHARPDRPDYTRIREFIKPVHVHVNGNFVKSGGPEIAAELEKFDYAEWGAEPDAAIPQEVF